MGKNKSKVHKKFSTIGQIIMVLGILFLNGLTQTLLGKEGGVTIAIGFVYLFVIGYLYLFLIGLLKKDSIKEETENYAKRKWYKKSKVWLSALFVAVFFISALSIQANLISIIITIILVSLALLTLIIPRITIPIIVIYFLAEITMGFISESVYFLTAIGSLLVKGAYILLSVRVFLVASKLNKGKKVKFFSKMKDKRAPRELHNTKVKEEYSYTPRAGVNKIIIWGLSVSLFVLIWIGVFSLLGFRLNKDYFTYDEDICIENKWESDRDSKGISDCVYWARYNDMVKGWNLKEEWDLNKEALMNCSEDCTNSNLSDYEQWKISRGEAIECDFDPNRICDYSDYVDFVHYSNQDYLKSKDRDVFVDQCVKEYCKRPALITIN